MSFEPLHWLIGTLTPWHLVIWVALAALPSIVIPLVTKQKFRPAFLAAVLWMFACLYGIFGLVLGQLFGDKYDYLEILPIGFLFGAAFMLLPATGHFLSKDPRNAPSLGFTLFGAVFGGLFFGSCTWLFPRVVGFGLIEFPKYSWGVQL